MNFLKVADIAETLNVNPVTIRREIYSKRLPAIKVGTHWRVAETDFKRWMRNRRSEQAQ